MIFCLLFLLVGCSDVEKTEEKTLPASLAIKTSIQGDHILSSFVDGTQFDTNDYKEKRLLLGFFNYKNKDATHMLKTLQKLKQYESKYNFKIFGVSINYNDIEGLKAYLKENNIVLPIVLEGPALAIAEKYKLENEVAFVGLDAKHKAFFGVKKYIFVRPGGEQQLTDYVKENLSVKTYQPMEPRLGINPTAPDFEAKTMDGKTIRLSQYKNKVVLLFFFSPTCPHCRNEVTYLRDDLYKKYQSQGLVVLGVVSSTVDEKNKKILDSFKITWPVIVDTGLKLRKQFSHNRSVPENFIIDKAGKVVFHAPGYAARFNDLYELKVRKLLGLKTDVSLSDKHFTNAQHCGVCHEDEYMAWSLTSHAQAWETLSLKSETGNEACVACHTTGFNHVKGYKPIENTKTGKTFVRVPYNMTQVQCEVCHGLGGPHVTKENPMAAQTIKKTCLACHTEKWSPDFDLEKLLPLVNHSRKEEIKGMTLEQRETLIEN